MEKVAFISFLVCLIFLLLLGPLAQRWGWVDRPGGRKFHERPVPLVGGVAIFLGIAAAFSLFDPRVGSTPLFFDLFPLLLLGLIDDIWHLRPVSRLVVQIAIVMQLVLAHGVLMINLGDLFGFGQVQLGWLSTPFTIVALVGLMNAVNLVDGLDGLAGGLTVIALLLLLLVSEHLQISGPAVMLAVAALGALAAFMFFNLRHPLNKQAKFFLGDAGSLLLGMVLGTVLFKLTQRPAGPSMPAVLALWVVALPLFDTCSVMIRRVAHGKNPFSGDRQHFHHLLLEAGFSHGQSVLVMLSLALAFGLLGVLAWMGGTPEWVLMVVFVAIALAFLAWVFNPERAVRSLEASRLRIADKKVEGV